MRILYKFNINKLTMVEEPVEKEIDGKPTKVLEKVEKSIPNTYIIKRPTRDDYEEAEFIYAQKFGDDIRKGILTRSEIVKRFATEDVVIKRVYDEYATKENEYQRVKLLEKTEENITRQTKLEQELLNILVEIQNFENTKSSVFDHTAESRARNKTVFWWILNLAYKLEDNKETPLFEGSNFEEKTKSFDILREKEDDNSLQEAIQRYFYFIPVWYTGQLTKEEDFKKAEDLLKVQIQKDKNAQIQSDNEARNLEQENKKLAKIELEKLKDKPEGTSIPHRSEIDETKKV